MASVLAIPGGGGTVTIPAGPAGKAIAGIIAKLADASAAGNLTVVTPTVVAPSTVPGGVGSDASHPILIPAPPSDGKVHLLVLDATQQGFVSIPAGWDNVVYYGSGHLTGTVAGSIIGDLNANVTSPLISVVDPGPGLRSTVNNLANHSVGGAISDSFGLGNVIAFGDNETVTEGNQTSSNTTIIGNNVTLNVGDLSGVTPFTKANQTSIFGNNDSVNLVPLTSQTMFIGGPKAGATVVPTGTAIQIHAPSVAASSYFGLMLNYGVGTTIQANSGELTLQNLPGSSVTYQGQISNQFNQSYTAVFDAGVGSSFQSGAGGFQLDNFGATGTDTVVAGNGANDTIFAYSPVMYDGTQASSSHLLLAIPGTGASVNAGSNAIVAGGTSGGAYVTVGSGSGQFFFLGASAASAHTDNIFQTASSESASSAVVFSNTNETINVQMAAGAASAPGAWLVAEGDNTAIDATSSGGSNAFILFGQQVPGTGAAITQNATVTGATTGHDVFFVEADGNTSAAHTFTIGNFQGTDAVVVFKADGLSATDITTINDYNTGNLADPNVTGSSFTLQDGTTVKFTDASAPTAHAIQFFKP